MLTIEKVFCLVALALSTVAQDDVSVVGACAVPGGGGSGCATHIAEGPQDLVAMMQHRAELRQQQSASEEGQIFLVRALFGALRERLAGNVDVIKAIDAALDSDDLDPKRAVSTLQEKMEADPKIKEDLDMVLAEWLASGKLNGAQHVPKSTLLAMKEQLLGTVQRLDQSLKGKDDEETTTTTPEPRDCVEKYSVPKCGKCKEAIQCECASPDSKFAVERNGKKQGQGQCRSSGPAMMAKNRCLCLEEDYHFDIECKEKPDGFTELKDTC